MSHLIVCELFAAVELFRIFGGELGSNGARAAESELRGQPQCGRNFGEERGEQAVAPARDYKQLAFAQAIQRSIDDLFGSHPEAGASELVTLDAKSSVKLGVSEAGAEGLHGYLGGKASQFEVKTFGEGSHPAFCGTVADAAGVVDEGRNRRHVDDGAEIARNQIAESRVSQAHGSHHVQLVHRFLSIKRRFPEPAHGAEACIVDKQREAVFKADSFGDGGKIGLGGKVRLHHFDSGWESAREFNGELLQAILAAGDEKEIVFGRELAGECGADTAGSAGDGNQCPGQKRTSVCRFACYRKQLRERMGRSHELFSNVLKREPLPHGRGSVLLSTLAGVGGSVVLLVTLMTLAHLLLHLVIGFLLIVVQHRTDLRVGVFPKGAELLSAVLL